MDTSIPNDLRKWRKAKGFRQLDVACKLGFSSTDRISKWEKGISYPHLINLFKLCAIYEVMPQELYGEVLRQVYQSQNK